MDDSSPPKSVNWSVLGLICLVLVGLYLTIPTAAANYQNSQTTIMQILEHQRLQDDRIAAVEEKVDRQGELLNSIDKATSVIASQTQWMAAWIRSGGEKQK